MKRAFFAVSLLIAIYVALSLWPYENTLTLAAEGKISFNAAWGYRFRSADLIAATETKQLVLQIFRPAGARILCLLLVFLHLPALLRRTPRALSIAAAFAAGFSLILFFTIANPVRLVNRQRVLGGASFLDELRALRGGEKIPLSENCVAVVNPNDLRGVSAAELIELRGLRALLKILTVDLKIVEENYRLLALKDQKGAPLFSDAARTFAAAETGYANKLTAEIATTPRLCLIANFDTLPERETAPFSRAHKILEIRRKAGLDTKVIQLPGRR